MMKSWLDRLLPGRYEQKLEFWRKNLKGITRAKVIETKADGTKIEIHGNVRYFEPALDAYSFVPDKSGYQKFYDAHELFPETEL